MAMATRSRIIMLMRAQPAHCLYLIIHNCTRTQVRKTNFTRDTQIWGRQTYHVFLKQFLSLREVNIVIVTNTKFQFVFMLNETMNTCVYTDANYLYMCI